MTTKTESNGRMQSRIVYSYTRWSSTKQGIAGDSDKRQLEAAKGWCAGNGYTLADERFVDAGISAFRGKNQAGDLGRLVERLQPGNILLVEDADRLSRQGWKPASDFVERVLAKGAEIVTLKDGNRLTLEGFRQDPGCFLRLILSAHLGHAEDVKKSVRVKAAWVTKQAEIREGKACRQKLPGWLEHEKTIVSGKTILGKVRLVESKAATVREIFRLTLSGMGARAIAREFNAKGVPSVSGQAKHWNGYSLLACILRNPAVIGDYRVIENKKPTGEVIKGLFPAVVDSKTFYAANAAATGHRKQTTPTIAQGNNLFTGLVRCPECGGNMSLRVNRKTAGGKVYRYLHCSQTKAGRNEADCKCHPKYDAFESSMLGLLSDSAALRKALGQPVGEPTDLAALRGRMQAADAKLNDLMAILDATPSKALGLKVQQAELEAEAMRASLMEQEAAYQSATPPSTAYDEFRTELAAHVAEPEYRERVKACLRSIIERVDFLDKTTFLVHFVGGHASVEVMMTGSMDGQPYKWQEAKRQNPVLVP